MTLSHIEELTTLTTSLEHSAASSLTPLKVPEYCEISAYRRSGRKAHFKDTAFLLHQKYRRNGGWCAEIMNILAKSLIWRPFAAIPSLFNKPLKSLRTPLKAHSLRTISILKLVYFPQQPIGTLKG